MHKSLSLSHQSSVTSSRKPSKSRLAVAVSVGFAIMSGSVTAESVVEATADPVVKAAEEKNTAPSLEVITVTATRRAAKLQDIPYNISAVSGDQLAKVGATGLMDVVNMVPGLASPDTGQRQSVNNSLIMRGLNANNPGRNSLTQNMTDPAVSMYVNDIPMFFNVSLSDIQRVEVLRGPQGTLYGSGSVGGTLRMILNEPALDIAEGRVSAQISNNAESGELNYQTAFVGNLPLSDDIALRVNAGYTEIGGVTDANGLVVLGSDGDPVLVGDIDSDAQLTSKKDSDSSDSWYLRGALLVKVNDDVDAVLNVIHQKNTGEGDTIGHVSNDGQQVDPWQHTRRVLSTAEFETDVVSLEVTADLGFASLTSATGYSKNDQSTLNDNSGLYGDLSALYFGFPEGQTVVPTTIEQQSKSLTQEFRLVSQTEGDWDWVTGVWYRHQEQSAEFVDFYLGYDRWASDPTSSGSIVVQGFSDLDTVADFWGSYYQGTPNPELTNPYVQNRAMDFKDLAIFGEATYHISDDWQVTFGARKFWQEFSQDNLVEFRILGPEFTVDQHSSADFSDQIFKFNTSYDLAADTMVYFTWAQGFRHGGTNGFPTVGTGAVTTVPLQYEADKADNYEIGLKGELFGSQARYTASIYQINWDKPQLDVFLGLLGVPSVMNGDEARSRGLELELTAQLTDDLDMTLGYSYTQAELVGADLVVEGTSGFTVAHAGDTLPGVPSNQLSLTMNYFIPLENSELHFFYNGSYRDKVETTFNADFGDYAELDGFTNHNIGVTWMLEEVKVGLFVKNLTNEEGVSGVRTNRADYNDFGYLSRPRSIGLRISYEFE